MKIGEGEKKDLFDKMVAMADETLSGKDNGKYSLIIDLQDGVPVKVSEVFEVNHYTRVKHRLVAVK